MKKTQKVVVSFLLILTLCVSVFLPVNTYALAPESIAAKAKILQQFEGDDNICFVLSRIGGTDGVSLEVMHWIKILVDRGKKVSVFTGLEENTSFLPTILELKSLGVEITECPTAELNQPEETELFKGFFAREQVDPEARKLLKKNKAIIKESFLGHIAKHGVNKLVFDNLQLSQGQFALGLAANEAALELAKQGKVNVLSRLHDFPEDRPHYWPICKETMDMLKTLTPKNSAFKYVVINKHDLDKLEQDGSKDMTIERHIKEGTIDIDNIFDFHDDALLNIAKNVDKPFVKEEVLGIPANHTVFLAPVRPVSRKRIDAMIKMLWQMRKKGLKDTTLLITHPESGALTINPMLKAIAKLFKINLVFADEKIQAYDKKHPKNKCNVNLWELYGVGDIVLYLSDLEGWGNALLEAIYFEKPVIINQYPVYMKNILPRANFNIPATNIKTIKEEIIDAYQSANESELVDAVKNMAVENEDNIADLLLEWVTVYKETGSFPENVLTDIKENKEKAAGLFSYRQAFPVIRNLLDLQENNTDMPITPLKAVENLRKAA